MKTTTTFTETCRMLDCQLKEILHDYDHPNCSYTTNPDLDGAVFDFQKLVREATGGNDYAAVDTTKLKRAIGQLLTQQRDELFEAFSEVIGADENTIVPIIPSTEHFSHVAYRRNELKAEQKEKLATLREKYEQK